MFESEFVAVATTLAQAAPGACDRDELAVLVTISQRARGWLDAFDARVAMAARRLAGEGKCEAPGALLAGGGRRSTRDAEAAARRSKACEQAPSFHDALAAGEVSAGHVDALAHLSSNLDDEGRAELKTLEPALLGSARTKPVEEFARECEDLNRILSRDEGGSRLAEQKKQRRLRRWIDRATGMCHTHLELDPETDAKVASALSEAIATERSRPDDGRTWDQIQADALAGLITGAQSLDHRVPELSVLIDVDTLRTGLRHHGVSETAGGNPLPPATVRRLGCEAGVIPIVLGANGEVLDVGREQRLATRAQRRALRAMYRTCAFPCCRVGFDACRIHHVWWWERNGPTDLANLIPLCSEHHHLVHEGGWALTLRPDRTITLLRPDGTLHFAGSTVDRTSVGDTAAPATPEPSGGDVEHLPCRGRPPPRAPAA
jgi:hypothetical protein